MKKKDPVMPVVKWAVERGRSETRSSIVSQRIFPYTRAFLPAAVPSLLHCAPKSGS